MKAVLFNDGWLELRDSAKNVYSYIADKLKTGYDQSKFSIFEESNEFNTFDEYFEHGDEIELEDLQYDYE
jgi:hypothetical protein